MTQQTVTQKTVADLAGVSFMTVSRVLANPDKVSPKTRERVLAAIKETGYVVNQSARALAARRTNIIGVLIPTITNGTYATLIAGLEPRLKAAGYNIILVQTGYSEAQTIEAVRVIVSRQPDAVIMYSHPHAQGVVEQLVDHKVPVVEVWGLPSKPIDVGVGIRMAEAGKCVGRHLMQKRYKQIAYFGGNHLHDVSRFSGLSRALKDAGYAPPIHINTPAEDQDSHFIDRGRTYLEIIFAQEEHIDAVFCSSDILAAAVVFESQKSGLRIPDELAICGFGGAPLAAAMTPRVTTLKIPSTQIGEEAANAAISLCNGDNSAASTALDFELIAGNTT